MLALDWKPSDATLAWAQGVIDRHPKSAVILTTHDFASTDQIFLTLNGHYWPPGRTTLKNAAGHDVHAHIANDVETFSPWIMEKPARDRNPLEQREIELTDPANRFSVPIDFAVAYWRFDEKGPDGMPVPENAAVRDLSGRGNDRTRATLPGSGADALTFSADWSPAHAWMGLLSRMGTGADADISTNWSHELPLDTWVHVAVVNDGRRTVMYIDGAQVLRNPSTPAVGITTVGKPWLVGATTYDNVVEQGFHGRIGDIRVVDRPLRTEQFMTGGLPRPSESLGDTP